MKQTGRFAAWTLVLVAACACGGGGSSSPTPPAPGNPVVSPQGSASPSPTPTVRSSPNPTPSPTTTLRPSSSPSASPSPSPTVRASASPSPTPTPSPSPVSLATNGPPLTIDANAGRHAISNDIYGVTIFWNPSSSNYAAFQTFARAIRLPANRYGGDATTRYNWQVDSTNAGSDFYFMAGNGQATPVAGASVDAIVTVNKSLGTKSIITTPIINYITKSSTTMCSYPQPSYPPQTGYNPYVHLANGDACGSGTASSNNTYLVDTNYGLTDIPNAPSIQQAWVSHLVGKFGAASSGGVPIYELDNEPNGWLAVHHDIHPQGIGYTELLNRSIAYATAIKAADPSALVLGPDDIPPADEGCNQCGNDNASAHGNTPLGLWYLQQFAAAQQSAGRRLLDYYAMHYPGGCCFSNNGTIAAMITAIQRHQGWIAQGYPGTKLAYDEWNRGTGNAFSVGLATADGIGVFGQQGVDLASFWGLDDPAYPSAYAYRMFRNYDGNGNGFGETSIAAATGDATKLTVYAAQRSADSAVTIIVVNPTGTDWTSAISIANLTLTQAARTYRYTSANSAAIVAGPNAAKSGSALVVTFPANSITMIVQPSGGIAANGRRR